MNDSSRTDQGWGEDKPILSIHVPKTAGLALAQFYEDLFGPEQVRFFYRNHFFRKPAHGTDEIPVKKAPIRYRLQDAILDTAIGKLAARTLRRYMVNSPPLLKEFPTDFKILHGHFRIDPGERANYRLVIVLRDPLKRTASLFRYLYQEHTKGNSTPAWYAPTMSFEHFATIHQNRNVYPRYLNGLKLDDFCIVGITEDLESYYRAFDPTGSTPLRKINTSGKMDIEMPRNFAKKFRSLNEKDYKLYQEAQRRSAQLSGQQTKSIIA